MSTYQRPNILLMMTDQQRFDSLGCYGFEAGHTPNLDRLAEESVVFEHCYVNNPLCTPSRASMLTGKHIQGHGVYRLYDHLPEDQILFTEWLLQSGYLTALFGKLHVSSIAFEEHKRNLHDGFEIYEWCLEHSLNMDSPFNGYVKWLKATNPEFFARLYHEGRKLLHIPRDAHMTHWAAERTIDFIRSQASSARPFFCMMSVFDPHDPYEDYPLEMSELIEADKIPVALVREGELDSPGVLRRIQQESVAPLPPHSSQDAIRKARLGYHASIALIDLEFGRVLDILEQAGIADNTLVIFVSDHGDLLGDHHQFGKGAALYDPCVRVPFIMRWPARFKGGQRVTHLVQPHDIAATVLAAAGAFNNELQTAMPDSIDLSPLCAGESDKSHDYVYCVYRNSGLSRTNPHTCYFDPPIHVTMIRDKRFKLIVYHDINPDRACEGQLFDMQADPLETENLWNSLDYANVRREMTEKLMNWLVTQEVRYLGSRGGESLPPWRRRKRTNNKCLPVTGTTRSEDVRKNQC